MHRNNFVVAVKVNGKVLRESNDRVELPFGSEYSVLLKNLDTVRMQAQISIDGQDATGWLVVDPGKSVDIERFYRQNRERGNRFKFIERTQRIEEHRGVGAEDGLVRVEFRRERVYEPSKIVEHHTYHHHSWPYVYPRPYPYPWPHWNFCGTLTQSDSHSGTILSGTRSLQASCQATQGANNSSSEGSKIATMNVLSQAEGERGSLISANEIGITVDGSISNQQFVPVAGFECEASEAIMLHLVGRKAQAAVKVAKTVDRKPVCDTCGKTNKGTAKFCIECGTSLEKV